MQWQLHMRSEAECSRSNPGGKNSMERGIGLTASVLTAYDTRNAAGGLKRPQDEAREMAPALCHSQQYCLARFQSAPEFPSAAPFNSHRQSVSSHFPWAPGPRLAQ